MNPSTSGHIARSRLLLNTPFAHPALAGIYSTEPRVKALDEVLAAIGRFAPRGEPVLMANNIPMLHFLTGTMSALGNPWIIIEDLGELRRRQEKLTAAGRFPLLFVYARVNVSDNNWPCSSSPYLPEDKPKIEYLLGEYVKRLSYAPLWQNNEFIVYGRPGLHSSGLVQGNSGTSNIASPSASIPSPGEDAAGGNQASSFKD